MVRLNLAIVLTLVAACSITLSSTAALAEECETPLPGGYEVESPGANVPEEFARYSGKWGNGKWDGNLCHTLVVTSVTENGDVSVIYSWGKYWKWGIKQPDYTHHKGTIVDGKLKLEQFRNGAEVKYWFIDEDLKGTYKRRGSTSLVTLEKIR